MPRRTFSRQKPYQSVFPPLADPVTNADALPQRCPARVFGEGLQGAGYDLLTGLLNQLLSVRIGLKVHSESGSTIDEADDEADDEAATAWKVVSQWPARRPEGFAPTVVLPMLGTLGQASACRGLQPEYRARKPAAHNGAR